MTCIVCDRNTPRAGYVCGPCRTRLADQLREILDCYSLTQLVPSQGGDGRSNERTLGVRIGALDFVLGHDVLPTLESWERCFREEFGLSPYGPASLSRAQGQADPIAATLSGVVEFLMSWLGRICDTFPAVDDFAREVHSEVKAARAAAQQVHERAWVVTCPADDDEGQDCGRLLRVTGQDFGTVVVCRDCGTHWDVRRLLLVTAHDSDAGIWLPATELAMLYGVAEVTLRRWARSGAVLRAHGRYEAGAVRQAMLDDTLGRSAEGA